MVEVFLYGEWRERLPAGGSGSSSPLRVPLPEGASLARLLARLEIPPETLGNVFLNGRLLFSRSPMNQWLAYPSERERIPEGGRYLDAVLREGDRVGLFPRNMGFLVV